MIQHFIPSLLFTRTHNSRTIYYSVQTACEHAGLMRQSTLKLDLQKHEDPVTIITDSSSITPKKTS